MTIPYQFLSHLNNRPFMKKNQPASLQKTNLDLHVPVWIVISLECTVPYLKSQSELNHLVTDINLLEIQAELLASHLKGWNLLQQGVKSVIQETIAITAIIFFKDGKAVYCKR